MFIASLCAEYFLDLWKLEMPLIWELWVEGERLFVVVAVPWNEALETEWLQIV